MTEKDSQNSVNHTNTFPAINSTFKAHGSVRDRRLRNTAAEGNLENWNQLSQIRFYLKCVYHYIRMFADAKARSPIWLIAMVTNQGAVSTATLFSTPIPFKVNRSSDKS